MKLGIINSAFGQAGVDTKTGLEHIARIGFDTVDIFTEAMTITDDEINLIENTCADNNLPIVSVVLVAAGLIDFNDPVRDFHVDPVCTAIIQQFNALRVRRVSYGCSAIVDKGSLRSVALGIRYPEFGQRGRLAGSTQEDQIQGNQASAFHKFIPHAPYPSISRSKFGSISSGRPIPGHYASVQ